MEPHFYNVDINWENSRKGIVCSPELNRQNGICKVMVKGKRY